MVNSNERFECRRIQRDDEGIIQTFEVAHKNGGFLADYLKYCALNDEDANEARTYLVIDKVTGELVAYFSLKAGFISTRNSFRSFDSIPGVELANFGVNGAYRKNHRESHGIGKLIFADFILPKVEEASEIVGMKVLYIFALPYKDLIERYEEYNFRKLSGLQQFFVHMRIRPRYDRSCIFMYQVI